MDIASNQTDNIVLLLTGLTMVLVLMGLKVKREKLVLKALVVQQEVKDKREKEVLVHQSVRLLLGQVVQVLSLQDIFYVMDQQLVEPLMQLYILLLGLHMVLETGQLHLIFQI